MQILAELVRFHLMHHELKVGKQDKIKNLTNK